MLLDTLKILATLITAGLAVFAVTTDFKDKKTKKLRVSGKWYIVLFLISVLLSYLFDKLSDTKKDKETKDNFSNTIKSIRDSTDKLLKTTKDSLDNQFIKISDLTRNINENLNRTSSNMQFQFNQTNEIQRNIGSLINKVKETTQKTNELTEKTNTELKGSISIMSNLAIEQQKSIDELQNISMLSSKNLNAINQVFNQVNAITAPLAPIQFVFRIKYKLKNALFSNQELERYYKTIEINRNTLTTKVEVKFPELSSWLTGYKHDLSTTGNINWLYNAITQDNKSDFKKFNTDFFKHYSFYFKFYTDSLLEKLSLFYCYDEGYKCETTYDEVFISVKDSSLIREISVTYKNLSINPLQLKSINDLITHGGYLEAEFMQFGEKKYTIKSNSGNYIRRIEFGNISFEPFVIIKYGKDYSLSVRLPENLMQVKTGQYDYIKLLNVKLAQSN